MKQRGMDSDFEAFRRERNMRRQQRTTVHRPQGGNQEVWEQLEQCEANDLHNQIINAEVDDFFTDATRMAASIVKKVAENRKEELSERLRREMEEFLAASIQHARNLMLSLPTDPSQHGQATVDANLRNLDVREIDEFRAEGTAQLTDKHFGRDIFPSGKFKAASPSSNEPQRLQLQAEDEAPAAPPQPVAAPQPAPPVPVAKEPAGSAFDPLQEEPEAVEDEMITPNRMRLDDSALDLEDDIGADAGFAPGRFVDRLSGVQRLGQPEPTALPPTLSGVHAAVGNTAEVEDQLPLAALYADEEDVPSGFGIPDETPLPVAESADAVAEAAPEPATSAATAEPVEDLAAKQERIKAALLELVKQGVMTKDQARAAYAAQMKS